MREACYNSETGYGSLIANPYTHRLFKTYMIHTLPVTLGKTSPIQYYQDSSSGQVRRAMYDNLFAIAKFAEETQYGEIQRGVSLNHFPSQTAFGERYRLTFTDLPPSGCDHATNCMVVTDRLTKGVELEGLHNISAEVVAQRLFECHSPIHGIPTAITSDKGPQFVCNLWRHFCKLLDVEQRLSTAYHLQTDGTTEQMNQEIEKMICIWATYTQELACTITHCYMSYQQP
jgi:hypothetical protein